jgi:hypothetical protein
MTREGRDNGHDNCHDETLVNNSHCIVTIVVEKSLLIDDELLDHQGSGIDLDVVLSLAPQIPDPNIL